MSLKNLFLSTILALTLLSENAHAACTGSQPNISCENVSVLLLYLEVNGGAYIKVDGGPELMPCSTPASAGYIYLPGTASKFNAIYATLLLAQTSGRKVSIRIDPNVAACTVAYVTLASQ